MLVFGGSENLFSKNSDRTLKVTLVFDDNQFSAHKSANLHICNLELYYMFKKFKCKEINLPDKIVSSFFTAKIVGKQALQN